MTLAEKLVTAFIIGLLGAIAAPGWVSFVAAQQLRTDADQIQILLRAAQSEAKKQRSHTRSVLRNCQTDSSCLEALQADSNQQTCVGLIQRLIDSPSLLLAYRQRPGYVVWEDGTCSHNLITSENQTAWGQFASPSQEPLTASAWFSLPSWVLPAANAATTAPTKTIPTHRGSDRRQAKAENKPAKNKLTVTGCFNASGVFYQTSGTGFVQVNWATLPANTIIITKSPLCAGTGTK